MSRLGRQLVLDIARAPSFASEDFLVAGCNAAAYSMVRRWPDWPDSVLLLVGPAGCGKSHLAAIWAGESGARSGVGEPTEAGRIACVLEDCDRDRPDDAPLFHLLNTVRESGGSLLLTARTPPNLWKVSTPDLLSRLRLAPSAVFGRPDEILLKAVAVKLFADRQIDISEDLVAFVARHSDQSLAFVRSFVEAVDDASLASGRRITRGLAADIIAALQDARADEG